MGLKFAVDGLVRYVGSQVERERRAFDPGTEERSRDPGPSVAALGEVGRLRLGSPLNQPPAAVAA